MRVFTLVQSFRKNKKIHILLKTFAIWLAQVIRSQDTISYYTVIQMETQGSWDNMQNDRCTVTGQKHQFYNLPFGQAVADIY